MIKLFELRDELESISGLQVSFHVAGNTLEVTFIGRGFQKRFEFTRGELKETTGLINAAKYVKGLSL